MAGINTFAQIYWLLAITMIALTLSPFAVLAALRISLEQ
jgi:ABC-type transport system involved in cytochrome c biogenesis permease component